MNTTIDRRQFLAALSMSAAGAAFLPHCAPLGNDRSKGRPFSGGELTLVCLAHDAATLAPLAFELSNEFKTALSADINAPSHGDFSRIGGLVRASDDQMIALLQELADQPGSETRAKKLALALGWLTARAGKRQLEPLYRREAKRDKQTPPDIIIYHDAVLMRELYGESALPSAVTSQDVENLFLELLPRMITRTHTLTPDYDDGEGWVLRIMAWRERTIAMLRRYGRAYHSPDPEKYRAFVERPHFYDRDDDLLRMVRAAQEERTVSGEALAAALRSSQPRCLYAQALSDGLRAIETAQQWFNGQSTKERFRKAITQPLGL